MLLKGHNQFPFSRDIFRKTTGIFLITLLLLLHACSSPSTPSDHPQNPASNQAQPQSNPANENRNPAETTSHELLPFKPDTSINQFIIGDRVSSNLLPIAKSHDSAGIRYYFITSDKTAELCLIFHYGSTKGIFSEFSMSSPPTQPIVRHQVLQTSTLKTSLGITLGMDKTSVITILTQNQIPFTEQAGVLTIQHSDFQSSPFLQRHNMPVYYGKLYFTSAGLLNKYEFGFSEV